MTGPDHHRATGVWQHGGPRWRSFARNWGSMKRYEVTGRDPAWPGQKVLSFPDTLQEAVAAGEKLEAGGLSVTILEYEPPDKPMPPELWFRKRERWLSVDEARELV